MLHHGQRGKLFSRRAAMLAGVKLGLFTVLAGRLYYLQVIEADRYAVLSERNRVSVRLITPPRGPIVDRYGVPLAENRQNYRLVIVPEQAGDVRRTLDLLAEIVSLSERERQKVLREVERSSRFAPVAVRENLTWNEVARVEVNSPDLPGAMIDMGRTRFYPQGEKAVHVIGYVAAVSKDELTDDPFLRLPDARIGKSGVERQYDRELRGTGGSSCVEVNALGRVIRELDRDPGQVGRRAVLNIDMAVQELAYQRLGDHTGAVVAVDATNGEVLVMVSRPGFDPNAFTQGVSGDLWQRLSRDPYGPMINKAIAGQYAPGSTFKPVVALAALEANVVDPGFEVHCPGYLDFGNARFHCWEEKGHGRVDMDAAIRRSCDVYFYELSRRVGVDRIADMARRVGFGREWGIDLPGERRGLVPSREWKRGALGVPWQLGETLILGIGQGYLLATPLQLAMSFAAMVNGGRQLKPRVLRHEGLGGEIVPAAYNEDPVMSVSAEGLAFVKRAMDGVVNDGRGTAYRARIVQPEFAMGGKTGTSQVRRITRAERLSGVLKNQQLPREQRDHALFVGYAPVNAPRYVVAVVVEHGGGGAATAAPIARDVLLELQKRAAAMANPTMPATLVPGTRMG